MVALSAGSALAGASPQATLRSAFEAYATGGDGVFFATTANGAPAYFNAANGLIDFGNGAVRLGASDSEASACNVFGIWIFFYADKATLLDGEVAMSFGPVGGSLSPLAIQATTVKRVVDPNGSYLGGDPLWWESVGVPVYGTLAPGTYSLHVVSNIVGAFDVTYTIDPC